MTDQETKLWHEEYASEPTEVRHMIDMAFNAARFQIHRGGAKTAIDDRAERLIAAIYRYYVES